MWLILSSPAWIPLVYMIVAFTITTAQGKKWRNE